MSEGAGERADPLVRLAREAIESYIRKGEVLKPQALPDLDVRRAGVFVSLHRKDGSLRGCIGTTQPTRATIEEEIVGNLMLFENLFAKQRIKCVVHSKPKDPVIVHMTRSALGQILANLIDNSVYWLTRHQGDGKGGQINIGLTRLKQGFLIRFCDDGPGVDEADRERIFDPYYSTKPNGMGLGLYVARQVVERYGKLVYRDDCELAGACFEVVFERNVGL